MRPLRATGALIIGKLLQLSLKRLGRGGGTALPGLVALWVEPELLTYLSTKLAIPQILVTGTNGKTTTVRLLHDILVNSGLKVISNRSGSNLKRGLISALIENYSFFHLKPIDLAVWEIDEAILPDIINETVPRGVVFNNLFRDQLDRYGEIDTLLSKWRESLDQLSPDTFLVLNGDDPNISELVSINRPNTIRFGQRQDGDLSSKLPHAAESRHCPRCGKLTAIEKVYTAHYGKYNCPSCGFNNHSLNISFTQVKAEKIKNNIITQIEIKSRQSHIDIKTSLLGEYNLYNITGAIATALLLKIPIGVIQKTISSSRPAFGRGEVIEIDSRQLNFFLAKNPVGLNEIIKTLPKTKPKNFLLVLNDEVADGRDVSWIWDADFEKLVPKINQAIVSGTRAEDLALRLKYAGLKLDKFTIDKDLTLALKKIVNLSQPKANVFVLPTYTAMLGLRKILADWGKTHQVWQD